MFLTVLKWRMMSLNFKITNSVRVISQPWVLIALGSFCKDYFIYVGDSLNSILVLLFFLIRKNYYRFFFKMNTSMGTYLFSL